MVVWAFLVALLYARMVVETKMPARFESSGSGETARTMSVPSIRFRHG